MRRWSRSLLAFALLSACSDAERDSAGPPSNTGLRLLGGESADGFARATTPRQFVFPADHGSHPEYRTEWWYFTGNLATESGRHFGFELTFFRYALAPPPAPREGVSAWRTEQIWMAHFALTDTAGRRFIARERLTRGALGLAGAEIEPLHVWVKDWSATGDGAMGRLSARLEARDDGMGLALDLTSTVPYVAQGERGLDAKGAGLGNASYYYSFPRLEAHGDVTIDGESFAVTGLAWLDREWSTSSLDAGTVGWDWFALHLSDGSNLMFYRLRTAEGGASSFSGGTLVSGDGVRTRLVASDVTLAPLEYWTSGVTGVRYPVAWRLVAAKVGTTLEIRPYLADQELDLSVRYWEGAVHGEGVGPAGPVTAQGYLELAGY
jgi:predicted secreted hydrolase